MDDLVVNENPAIRYLKADTEQTTEHGLACKTLVDAVNRGEKVNAVTILPNISKPILKDCKRIFKEMEEKVAGQEREMQALREKLGASQGRVSLLEAQLASEVGRLLSPSLLSPSPSLLCRRLSPWLAVSILHLACARPSELHHPDRLHVTPSTGVWLLCHDCVLPSMR